ncbi:ATP-binding protein [Streptomyces albidoflavus]|uniref:ATP-binding protein n=1 Tax=Streptomyces albidoflavus TaxID=1886 RepID=UPI0034519287
MDTMSAEVDAVHTEASAAADARGTTRTFVGNLEPSVTPEAADAAVLVVSELVTNALRHGGGTCTLDLTAHPDGIEVAVNDRSPRAPRMRTPDLTGRTGGFGWPMVKSLSRATAVSPRAGGGKTVSALLAR